MWHKVSQPLAKRFVLLVVDGRGNFMAMFKYKARDQKGNLITGELEAISANAVASYLMQEQLTPTSIQEIVKTPSFFARLEHELQKNQIKPNNLLAFFRQMHALIKASVPIINALTYLLNATKSVALINCLKGLINDISGGHTLTQAFAKYPQIFAPIVISIIEAGENSGQLELAFLRIAEHLEFELNTKRQFKTVMRYPLMVIAAASIALMIINFVVTPVFVKLFASFKTELPLPTRILIAISNFFIHNWLYLLVAILTIAIMVHYYLKTQSGALLWDKYKLQIPVLGELLKQIILTRFARIFAMMMQSGVPISSALALAANVVDNTYIAQGILVIRSGVEHGEAITKSATRANIFPPIFLQMLSVGEETGSIEYLLLEIAKYYEDEIKYQLGRLSEIIEPILLVIMGGLVLVLALGVFLPMWNMVSFAR